MGEHGGAPQPSLGGQEAWLSTPSQTPSLLHPPLPLPGASWTSSCGRPHVYPGLVSAQASPTCSSPTPPGHGLTSPCHSSQRYWTISHTPLSLQPPRRPPLSTPVALCPVQASFSPASSSLASSQVSTQVSTHSLPSPLAPSQQPQGFLPRPAPALPCSNLPWLPITHSGGS